MPKLKFADDLPQPASVNAPLQCQICFESPAETAAEATPEEPLKSSKAPTNYFTPNILRKSWSRLVVSVVHLDALAFPVAAT